MWASRCHAGGAATSTQKAAAVAGGRLCSGLLNTRTWHRLVAAPPACCKKVGAHFASIAGPRRPASRPEPSSRGHSVMAADLLRKQQQQSSIHDAAAMTRPPANRHIPPRPTPRWPRWAGSGRVEDRGGCSGPFYPGLGGRVGLPRYAVAEVYDSGGEGAGLEEFEIHPALALGKERYATANQHREDPGPVLVDQAQRGRLGRESRAADRDIALPWLGSQPLDLLRQAA